MKLVYETSVAAMLAAQGSGLGSIVCYIQGERFRVGADGSMKQLKICGPRQRKPKVTDATISQPAN